MNERNEKLLASVLLVIITRTVFVVVGRWGGAESAPAWPWTALRIDIALPVVPAAVWIYLSWYVAPAVIFCAEISQFRRFSTAALLAFGICAAGWMLFPVSIDRPQLEGADGLSRLAGS